MRSSRILAAALLVVLSTTPAWAQSPFNVELSLRDNLIALQAAKKPVTVVLKNGDKYQATIAAVGDHNLVLTQPSQKEFFDVLVPLDEIAAVEARAR